MWGFFQMAFVSSSLIFCSHPSSTRSLCSLPRGVNTIMSANVKMHWQIWQYKYRTTNIIFNRERQFFLFMQEWLRNKMSLHIKLIFSLNLILSYEFQTVTIFQIRSWLNQLGSLFRWRMSYNKFIKLKKDIVILWT